MKRDEISKIVKNFGVNPRSKGFDYFVELVFLVIKDYEDDKIIINNYNLKKYYKILADKFEVREITVPSTIRSAVTTSNIYGNGITPKDIIDNFLFKIERQRKREK